MSDNIHMIEYWWQWKYVCTYVTTPIMRTINDTECTCAPPTRNPMSHPSNWPQQIWQHAPTVPAAWLTPLEPYTRALGPLRRVTVKRPSIVHCGPKPPEMMANHPAPISDSSFDSIWSLLKVERSSSKGNSIFWIFWICAIFEPPQTRGTWISETTVLVLMQAL